MYSAAALWARARLKLLWIMEMKVRKNVTSLNSSTVIMIEALSLLFEFGFVSTTFPIFLLNKKIALRDLY